MGRCLRAGGVSMGGRISFRRSSFMRNGFQNEMQGENLMNSFEENYRLVADFISSAFSETLKEPEGAIRHPFVSPGGPYSGTLWDWDSYWTLLAVLSVSERRGDHEMLRKVEPYAKGTFFNFLEHQGEDGALPILIQSDDEDPFDCLKSPGNNMAKPFLAQTGQLLMKCGMLVPEDFRERIYQIRAFHQCYESRYLHPETGLVVWAKDWGIGVDDDPAVWGRPERSCASIFLNVFLYRDYLAAAALCDAVGRPDYSAEYREKAGGIAAALLKYCWDEREKAFFSVDVQCRANLSHHRIWGTLNFKLDPFWHCLRLKILSWNCILPFWAGIGSREQFDSFVRENLTQERLWSGFGIRSLSREEPMYAPEVARGNPSNWLGPVWIVANYIVWETLGDRGYGELAGSLADAVIGLLAGDLRRTGMFHEYYSPETGLGVCGPHFMSWNALAALMEKGPGRAR